MKFLYNQDDLQLICKDIELETTEIHTSNDFYGQAQILKEYTNYNKPFKFVFEHSIMFHNIIWEGDLYSEMPVAFVLSNYRKDVYKASRGFKFIFNVGVGFLYAKKVYDRRHTQINNIKRTGTIVFPSHSSHHIEAVFDIKSLAKKIKNLAPEFQPVTVCIYWKDYLLGKHRKYEELGIPVISAGHIYDKNFLISFYDMCKNFKYATSNDFGSHVFYSIFSGCSFFLLEQPEISYDNPNKDLLAVENEEYIKNKDIFYKYFPCNKVVSNKIQMDFVSKYATTKILSPNKLKIILLFTEVIWFLRKKKILINFIIYNKLKLLKK